MDKSSTLDIIGLIEKNPITRLSKEYQSKLINKIKNEFSDKNQQLFVTSFYCYLNYNSKSDFIIDLNDIWKWVGFTRKDNAKRLLIKDFIKDLNYKILLLFKEEEELQHGGVNKERILMTINTFKKFCLKAGTDKANEIHDYYIKLEEILHQILDEETEELKNQLSIKDIQLKNKEIEHNKEIKISKQNTLIEKMKNKRCVYIAEIEENKFIKIGSTKEIYERYKQLKKQYGNCVFLEIFEHDNFREVEENILKDDIIKKHIHREKINNHMPQEIVKITNDFNFNQILSIVKKYLLSIYLFTSEQLLEKQKMDLENKKIDFEKQKMEHELLLKIINNNIYSKTVNKILNNKLPLILDNIQNDKHTFEGNKFVEDNTQEEQYKQKHLQVQQQDIIPDITFNYVIGEAENRTTQNPNYNMIHDIKVKGRKPKGRKLQKIDPNNLSNVVKVYESMIYALRSPENKGMQKSSIQTAIKKNHIYKGYRWNFVEENEDPLVSKIKDTVKCNLPIIGSVLKLNDTKTEIINSYSTKDILAKELKIGKTKMRNIIVNNQKFNNYYYIEYNKCPVELLNKFNKPLNRIIPKHSIQIKQINPITNDIIIFNSFNEITNKLGISSKTIKSIIENKSSYGGFYWEYYNE